MAVQFIFSPPVPSCLPTHLVDEVGPESAVESEQHGVGEQARIFHREVPEQTGKDGRQAEAAENGRHRVHGNGFPQVHHTKHTCTRDDDR